LMGEDLVRRPVAPDEAAALRRAALALILAFALVRVALAYSIGFGVDEAYTIAISRRLSLSYFDHPPLHQWLAHFTALLVGEGPALRLPFIALFAATGWLMFVLTRDLFGARAGVWAVFGLNATAFFLVSAGGWVVPDGPLLFALAAAAIVFERLFFAPPEAGAKWRLWLAGGFFLGLAGLSKYSAIFFGVGLVAFIALSPRQRHWFAHPAPYLAALLSLAMIAPVIIWNEQNEWVSFAFQGVRGAPGAHWSDERRLFLLCLSLPPIALFTLTPLWGAKGLPHWPMPGWFFAYPLLGAWLVEGWAKRFDRRIWAAGSAALLGAVVLVLASHVATGWITRAIALPRGAVDPTLEALDWAPLSRSPLLDAPGRAAFVVSTKWSDGGKIALALGPRIPVIVFSGDPRGMAFLDDSARFLGQDAVIVAPQERLASLAATFAPYFAALGAPQRLAFGRAGRDEIELALIPAHGLTRPFPLPYPRRAISSSPPKAPP
jgi:4-amino-4-deoxy-L-arabinose transferase-like glycosyltransferase